MGEVFSIKLLRHPERFTEASRPSSEVALAHMSPQRRPFITDIPNSSYQDRTSDTTTIAHHIDTMIHTVNQVHVAVARRLKHHGVTLGLSVRSLVFKPTISLSTTLIVV